MTQREKNALKGSQNRKNGEAFEFRVLRKMKASKPLYAIRSAGSHSVVDIVVQYKNYTRCIVCKNNGYICPAEQRELAKFISEVPEYIQVEFWFYKTARIMDRAILKRAKKK